MLHSSQSHTPVTIFLEKGKKFSGIGWGDYSRPRFGEFVFCTAMTGVEESLTDPSFAGQVLVSTVSHVGNTGFTGQDQESKKIWSEGLICRHLEGTPSNWRSTKSLPQWILGEDRFIVSGIDTRQMTIELREQGSQNGVVLPTALPNAEEQARHLLKTQVPDMKGRDLTDLVSCQEPYAYSEKGALKVAVWDFGVKTNTLRKLRDLGCAVQVLPARSSAEDLLRAGKNGILLSNGPGDPSASTHIISELRKILGRRRIFSICLGHQLVALAVGAKTYKMKFGHRGIHHPVVQLDDAGRSVRTWITSQNHGFAVDRDTLPADVKVSFTHGDDSSVEGLSLTNYRCQTVQFHPEAAPGPMDSSVLLDGFVSSMGEDA